MEGRALLVREALWGAAEPRQAWAQDDRRHLVGWERREEGAEGDWGWKSQAANGSPCLLSKTSQRPRALLWGERRGEGGAPYGEKGSGLRKLVCVTVDTADLRAWPLRGKLSVQPPKLQGMPPFWQEWVGL